MAITWSLYQTNKIITLFFVEDINNALSYSTISQENVEGWQKNCFRSEPGEPNATGFDCHVSDSRKILDDIATADVVM